MKYLLIEHYAGFDLDDPEDLVNNAFVIGTCTTKEEVIKVANETFANYINEQIESRFDLDNDEEKEEIEDFKSRFEVNVDKNFEPKLNETVEVGYLYLDAEQYFEYDKVDVIMLEN